MKHFMLMGCMLGMATINLASQNCPQGTTIPPNGISTVQVEIISFKPNSDMEGDDDYIPFYNNKADIYGKITIADASFVLPKLQDDDYPQWGPDGIFVKEVTSNEIPITILLSESDGGLTFDDDTVDINPLNGKTTLDLLFNLCAWTVSGDIQLQSASDIIEVNSGNSDNQGKIKLRVTTSTGRPNTSDDLALTDVRFVQVVYDAEALATYKPTVVVARIANNYSTDINTNFNISIAGAGVSLQESIPISLQAFEVKTETFFLNNPLRFYTSNPEVNSVIYQASIDDPGSVGLPINDCKAINDGNRFKTGLNLVQVPRSFRILWAKTGTILDGFNMTTDSQFDSIYNLGASYIDAIYPMPITHAKSEYAIIPPLSGGLLAFVTSIISPILPDAVDPRFVEPYAMILELNGIAHVLNYDRILGVLPSWDWFDRYPYLEDVTGLSLGEFMPGAVIFEPKDKNKGAAMTLPAHELGHTFGLSVDSRLKNVIDKSWVCEIDWPIIGGTGCGIVGGFDEYQFPDIIMKKGNPSAGYWIAQGINSSQLSGLVNTQQCEATCMMASSPSDVHLNWGNNPKWIDNPDYNRLLQRMSEEQQSIPNSLYISGLISANDLVYIANVFKRNKPASITANDTTGLYEIIFRDANGNNLKSENIPLQWKYTNDKLIMPITPFSVHTAYTKAFDHFVIQNRLSKKVITKQNLKSSSPVIRSLRKKTLLNERAVDILWTVKDLDTKELKIMVLAAQGRDTWVPLTSWINESQFRLKNPRKYRSLKIIVWDGINLVESEVISL